MDAQTERAAKNLADLIEAERFLRDDIRRFSNEKADESVVKEQGLQRLYRMVMGHEYEGDVRRKAGVS